MDSSKGDYKVDYHWLLFKKKKKTKTKKYILI